MYNHYYPDLTIDQFLNFRYQLDEFKSIVVEKYSNLLISSNRFDDRDTLSTNFTIKYNRTERKVDINLNYSVKDTLYMADSYPYLGELLLPYHSLVFTIVFSEIDASPEAYFSFNYIYLQDLNYREFMTEMRKLTSWFKKYEVNKMMLEIPK